MEINDIKKALYKEKPTAYLSHIRKNIAYYYANLLDGDGEKIFFEIPVSDMGDADFFSLMDAKLLIRWIVNHSVS